MEWMFLLMNELKWNVDGFFLGKLGEEGIGGILRSYKGEILCEFVEYVGVFDSKKVEFMVIVNVLDLFS